MILKEIYTEVSRIHNLTSPETSIKYEEENV